MKDDDEKVIPVKKRIDGSQLLDDVREFVGRFCAFPSPACLDVAALWAAHAHMIECFHTTPRLAMLSPEPGSGKTRVLEVLQLLTPSMLLLSASAPAVFRTIAEKPITLLFDEVDAIFKAGGDPGNDDLRALINSGYRRGATIPRCVGPTHDVAHFPVFAAKALAGLGDLPPTIMPRCVVFRMRKRAPGEHVEPFRVREHEEPGHALRDQLADWALTVGTAAGVAWPNMPDPVRDRLAEVWEPLFAVAEQAGGHWPETVWAACEHFLQDDGDASVSLGVRLLIDLRDAFGDAAALSTGTILARLCGEEPYTKDSDGDPVFIAESAPWGNLRGEPLNARGLARLVGRYDVAGRKVKIEQRSVRGYRKVDFWDAWQRYLPSPYPESPEPAELVEQRRQNVGFSVPDVEPVPEPGSTCPATGSGYGSGCGTGKRRCDAKVPEVPDFQGTEGRVPGSDPSVLDGPLREKVHTLPDGEHFFDELLRDVANLLNGNQLKTLTVRFKQMVLDGEYSDIALDQKERAVSRFYKVSGMSPEELSVLGLLSEVGGRATALKVAQRGIDLREDDVRAQLSSLGRRGLVESLQNDYRLTKSGKAFAATLPE